MADEFRNDAKLPDKELLDSVEQDEQQSEDATGADETHLTSDELAAEVGDILPTLASKLLHFIREVPGTDIPRVQEFLVRHLQVHGPCTASAIGSMLGTTSGPVTSLTKRLIAKGLVERVQDPQDGRVHWFQLTPAGIALAEKVVAHRQTQWKQLVERLGVARTKDAMQLMRETIEILEDES